MGYQNNLHEGFLSVRQPAPTYIVGRYLVCLMLRVHVSLMTGDSSDKKAISLAPRYSLSQLSSMFGSNSFSFPAPSIYRNIQNLPIMNNQRKKGGRKGIEEADQMTDYAQFNIIGSACIGTW